jgi:hypothetical protein
MTIASNVTSDAVVRQFTRVCRIDRIVIAADGILEERDGRSEHSALRRYLSPESAAEVPRLLHKKRVGINMVHHTLPPCRRVYLRSGKLQPQLKDKRSSEAERT